MGASSLAGSVRRSQTKIFRSNDIEEGCHEEGVRAMLNGPNKVGTGEVLGGITAPTFSAFLRPPVLELADRRGLQPRAHSGRPGSIPGWGTIFTPNRNLVHNRLR